MTTSESPAPARPVLVWDAPVRVFHWLLAASFIGAFVTGDSERWRLLHVTLGYTVAGLVAFRLLWGLVGTRHARFTEFVRGPAAAWQYLRSLLAGRAEHHVGHNPAAALAIIGLLAGAVLVSASGIGVYYGLGGDWLEELHEGMANAMFALVAVHLLGVIVGSVAHRENLVRSMLTGRKLGASGDGIAHAWRSVAALMLAAVLGFWAWQATQPVGEQQLSTAAEAGAQGRADRHQGRGHDDD